MKMDCGTLLLGLFIVCGPVSAFASQPVIRMVGFQGRNICLLCKTSSLSSNLQIAWKDGNGNKRTSSNSQQTDPKGMFTVLSYIDIAKETTNKYTCLVHSEGMKTEGEAVIQLSGELFPKEKSLSSWQIAFLIICIITLITIIAITMLFFKKRKLFQEMKTKIKRSEWRRIKNYAVSVTMNPQTAHPELTVSEDKTSVTHRETPHNTEERFDYPCVLGSDAFTSGKHYWEVEVGEKTAWDIGIAINVNNTADTSARNENWPVLRKDEKEYKAISSSLKTCHLSLRQTPKKIGVFLDCKGKTLSFYNADNESLLHKFHDISGNLYPLFSPGLNQGGRNSAPLRICPLEH
ncbi:erythroid membrane-associated protein-like [Heterodontus francisci]|uniref:erythroid membrane-associated protein-like n=1 Tax=Heterodontus francisci TaxID=7792 RepID=UPI00355AFEB0